MVPWLNDNGFRAIAWDQRSGGKTFGTTNRTVDGLADDVADGYCDAYPDLKAALDLVIANGLAERVVVWGSSYSAALVFRLAAEHPGVVLGVIAFSPATGGPLADCRGRQWADQVTAPVRIMRPESEMSRDSAIEQKEIFEVRGARVVVLPDGVHGSSMLVDARTEADMSQARADVIGWLHEVTVGDAE